MLRRVLLTALVGLLAQIGAAWAQSADPSFRIINNTPDVVNEVYASASHERSWGHDRLGTEIIRPGASHIVRLPADGNCSYDIRIVYQGGTAEERRNLDTCNLVDVVLGAAGPPQRAAPRGRQGAQQQGNPSFNLLNQSHRVIEEFYASPASEQNWGPDRLGNEVVQPGTSFAVRLPVGDCSYDLRVVWQGGQSQEFRNVNACALVNYPVR
jgi:hypothetical protein